MHQNYLLLTRPYSDFSLVSREWRHQGQPLEDREGDSLGKTEVGSAIVVVDKSISTVGVFQTGAHEHLGVLRVGLLLTLLLRTGAECLLQEMREVALLEIEIVL